MSTMETLPTMVIVRIASYLSPQDLIACSAVCIKWRKIFNIDAVWERHVHFPGKYYKIQAKYKEMAICSPDFSSLEPLCAAREQYIRDQYLRFNWRAGLLTIEEIKLKSQGKMRHINNVLDDEGNYWLFLNTSEAVEVWNITNKPFFQSIVLKNIPNECDYIYILDSKVLLIFSDLVQIYTFEHPKYELVFHCSFRFEDDLPTEDLPAMSPKGGKQFTMGNQSMKHLLNGHILIGFTGVIPKSVLPLASMHIWNMDSLVKLHRINMFHPDLFHNLFDDDDSSDKIIQIDMFEGDSQHLLIVVQPMDDTIYDSVIFLYSIGQRRLCQVKRSSPSRVLWTRIVNKHVLIFGFALRVGFCFSLVDYTKGEISMKVASRLGVDVNSQVIYRHPIFVQTDNTLFVIEAKDEKLSVKKIWEDQTFKSDIINVCGSGHFLFSKTGQGPIRLWDIDSKYPINDFPKFSEKIDIHSMKGLDDLDFPPKICCVSRKTSSVFVLSFW